MKKPSVAEIGEAALIARIARIAGPPPAGILGPGDDAAVAPAHGSVLLTTDAMVEGTHFRRRWATPEEVGYKALAASISDAAAMGGVPTLALASLVLPPRLPAAAAERLVRGMLRVARRENVCLAGGNLARGREISVTLTVMGEFPRGTPVLRSGAEPGDRVYLSGQPGLSHLGLLQLNHEENRGPAADRPDLWTGPGRRARRTAFGTAWARRALKRFLTPDPRLRPALDLLFYRPSAMTDTSDGLSVDLGHLAGDRVRIVVDAKRLPLPPGFRKLAGSLGIPPEAAALEGGEDYELLVCLPVDSAENLGPRPVIGGIRLTEIGSVSEGRGVFVERAGEVSPLRPAGFRHF